MNGDRLQSFAAAADGTCWEFDHVWDAADRSRLTNEVLKIHRSKRFSEGAAIFIVVLVAAVFTAIAAVSSPALPLSVLATVFWTVAFVSVLTRIKTWRALRQHFKKAPAELTHYTMHNGGLAIRTLTIESRYAWAEFQSLQLRAGFWLLEARSGSFVAVPDQHLDATGREFLSAAVKREGRPARCRKCKYDLYGAKERRCPECGMPFA